MPDIKTKPDGREPAGEVPRPRLFRFEIPASLFITIPSMTEADAYRLARTFVSRHREGVDFAELPLHQEPALLLDWADAEPRAVLRALRSGCLTDVDVATFCPACSNLNPRKCDYCTGAGIVTPEEANVFRDVSAKSQVKH